MSIHEKIFEISQKIHNLQRDTTIKMRSGESYTVILSEKVIEKLKPLFDEFKLVFYPTKITHLLQENNITTVAVEYILYDIETGENITIAAIGGGYDKMDKGPGKAFTYAHKKALIQAFNIKTSDDPDKIASDAVEADPLYNSLVDEVNNLFHTGYIGEILKDRLLKKLDAVKTDHDRLVTAQAVIAGYRRPKNDKNSNKIKENDTPPATTPSESVKFPGTKRDNQNQSNTRRQSLDYEVDIF